MKKYLGIITTCLLLAVAMMRIGTAVAAGAQETAPFVYEKTFEENGVAVTLSAEAGTIPANAKVELLVDDKELTGSEINWVIKNIAEYEKQSEDPDNKFIKYKNYDGDYESSLSLTYRIYTEGADGNKVEYKPTKEHPVTVSIARTEEPLNENYDHYISAFVPEEDGTLHEDSMPQKYTAGDNCIEFNATTEDYIIVFSRYIRVATYTDKVNAHKYVQNIINTYCDETAFLEQAFTFTDEEYALLYDTAKEAIKGCTTQEQKIRAITDYVAANIYYDYIYYDGYSKSTFVNPYDVLINQRTVCEGYANLMQALCISQDIPCMIVEGYDHVYNYAYASDEDRWICLDATWRTTNRYDFVNGVPTYIKGEDASYYSDPENQDNYDMTPEDLASAVRSHEVFRIDNLVASKDSTAYYCLQADKDVSNPQAYRYTQWAFYEEWDFGINGAKDEDVVASAEFAGKPVSFVTYNFSGRHMKSIDLSQTNIDTIFAYTFQNFSNLETVVLSDSTRVIES